jgi:hypothetical protein
MFKAIKFVGSAAVLVLASSTLVGATSAIAAGNLSVQSGDNIRPSRTGDNIRPSRTGDNIRPSRTGDNIRPSRSGDNIRPSHSA